MPKSKSSIPIDAIKIGDHEALAAIFDLPSWERINELNQDSIWEAGSYARKAVEEEALEKEEDVSEEDLEEADMKAQQEELDELFKKWLIAVTSAAETLFETVGLELEENTSYGIYYVFPEKSWRHVATEIKDILNGEGYFHFDSTKEFLDYGPYGIREAVKKHLSSVASRPNVYGDQSARSIFDRSFER